MHAGGNGNDGKSFSFGTCFLGTPGNLSQENGIPVKRRGVVGANKGESSIEGEDDGRDEQEERERVRREDGRIGVGISTKVAVASSDGEIWARTILNAAGEAMLTNVRGRERESLLCVCF